MALTLLWAFDYLRHLEDASSARRWHTNRLIAKAPWATQYRNIFYVGAKDACTIDVKPSAIFYSNYSLLLSNCVTATRHKLLFINLFQVFLSVSHLNQSQCLIILLSWTERWDFGYIIFVLRCYTWYWTVWSPKHWEKW